MTIKGNLGKKQTNKQKKNEKARAIRPLTKHQLLTQYVHVNSFEKHVLGIPQN